MVGGPGGAVGPNFERVPPAGNISAKFGLIWFSSFKGDDLNVIIIQNMPNLQNLDIYRLKKHFT